jgi:hypothetical protein
MMPKRPEWLQWNENFNYVILIAVAMYFAWTIVFR